MQSKTPLRRLAAVLPRYGESIGGGAETLVRGLVEEVAKRSLVKVEVWTTCAMDHRTWENQLPAGVVLDNGVEVHRFPVVERDVEVFLRHEISMRNGKLLSLDEQLDWLENSVNSHELYRHIMREGQNVDALLFAPYLFATSFWGAMIYPERSILVPCLHNEHYAYQDVFRGLFSSVRGLIFNAPAERELAGQLYKLPNFAAKSAVVGMGFTPATRRSDVSLSLPSTFVLYSGRKEEGKNLDLLLRAFEQHVGILGPLGIKLVLIGSGSITFRESLPEGVIDLGFVSEEEKRVIMARALALCQPSVNESFSIVLMESWLESTPVLVHGQCPVTREHAVESGGGLYFSNTAELLEVIVLLAKDRALRDRLGASGRTYVETEYSWNSVSARFFGAFEQFGYEISSLSENHLSNCRC